MENKTASFIVNFLLRAVVGVVLIYFINEFVLPDGNVWKVGVNTLSILTSGSLGIPGVCLLYGIMIYQNL